MSEQRLHLVFGGELTDPTKTEFKDVQDIHIVGMFPDYDSAYDAWKAEAHRTVDNAHMRYFIAHLHRLRDEEREASPTEELGG
ncbi:MAG: inositol monophosphatase [Rhodobacterales bacterium]|nr:MAG: inositol monophosphatase [Rhodobacterales bacterium]